MATRRTKTPTSGIWPESAEAYRKRTRKSREITPSQIRRWAEKQTRSNRFSTSLASRIYRYAESGLREAWNRLEDEPDKMAEWIAVSDPYDRILAFGLVELILPVLDRMSASERARYDAALDSALDFSAGAPLPGLDDPGPLVPGSWQRRSGVDLAWYAADAVNELGIALLNGWPGAAVNAVRRAETAAQSSGGAQEIRYRPRIGLFASDDPYSPSISILEHAGHVLRQFWRYDGPSRPNDHALVAFDMAEQAFGPDRVLGLELMRTQGDGPISSTVQILGDPTDFHSDAVQIMRQGEMVPFSRGWAWIPGVGWMIEQLIRYSG